VSIKYTDIFHCKTLQKFSQIWISGLKTNHLATLDLIETRKNFWSRSRNWIGKLLNAMLMQLKLFDVNNSPSFGRRRKNNLKIGLHSTCCQ
jgi:hypothetical protein